MYGFLLVRLGDTMTSTLGTHTVIFLANTEAKNGLIALLINLRDSFKLSSSHVIFTWRLLSFISADIVKRILTHLGG